MKRDNFIGTRFGQLTVISPFESDLNGLSRWVCKCDCGNETVAYGTNLKRGLTTSCGCKRKEVTREEKTTHGMYGTPLYHSWSGMLQRCKNSNDKLYYRYGGRGITVCEEWNDFENFYQWAIKNNYKPGLTIDRINNDDGYYPENCRWTDRITQGNNTSLNRRITYREITKTIAQWARLFKMDYNTLYRHLAKNDMSDFEKHFNEEDNICEESC